MALDLDEFVENAQGWRVGGSRKRRAHAKGIDARARSQQGGDALFIQIARKENLDVAPAGAFQAPPDPGAVDGNVAAVQAHAAWLATRSDHFFDGRAHVVGVEEQHGVPGEEVQKLREGFFLGVVRHDPRVRLRTVRGDSEAVPRLDVGGAAAAADKRGACREHAGLDAVRAARAEFDHRAAFGGFHDACSLCGNHGLEAHGSEERRFDDLRVGNGGGHAQQRFFGKADGAFRHSQHVSGKTEGGEIIEKRGANVGEGGVTPQIGDLVGAEAHVFEKVERLLKTGGHQEIAVRRQAADEQLKRSARLEVCLEVSRGHGQLVEIGEQAGRGWNCGHGVAGHDYAIRRGSSATGAG